MHIYMYTSIFLNVTHSVWAMLLVYMYSRLTIWYWVTSSCPLPTEEFLSLSNSSVAFTSLCTIEIWRAFPIHLGLSSLALSLFGSCLGSHGAKALWVQFLTFLGDTISQRTSRSFGSYSQSFLPFFGNGPWALGVGVLCRWSHWSWAPWLCVLIGLVLCNGLCLLQRGVSLTRGEDHTYIRS